MQQTHQTRLGKERPQRMAWCDCEAGAVGNCLEAPASHPVCRKHRLSPWHQGSRSESAETWRYKLEIRSLLVPSESLDQSRPQRFLCQTEQFCLQSQGEHSTGALTQQLTECQFYHSATLPVLDPESPAPPSRQTSNSLNVKCGQ